MNNVPTDIISYSKLIKKPEDFNFDWIVPEDQFKYLTELLSQEMFQALSENNQINREVFFADINFFTYLTQVLHAEIFKERIKRKGLNLSFGSYSKQYYFPDWKDLSNLKKQYQINEQFSFLLKLKENTKNILFNKHINILNRFSKPKNFEHAICVGVNSDLIQDYANKHKLFIDFKYASNILIASESSFSIDKEISSIIKKFVNNISLAIKKQFNYSLDKNEIIQCWEKRLTYLKVLLLKFMEKKDTLPNFLLVNQTMQPLHRLLGSAFKMLGKNSVAFDHGNTSNNRNVFICHIQPLNYNKIVTYGFQSAVSLKENLDTFRYKSFFQNLKFESAKDKSLYKNFQLCKNKKLPKKINTIMLVGWAMNSRRWHGESDGNFFFYKVLLEVNILKYLKTLGYKVLYKIHPSRTQGISKIIKSLDVEIVKGNFELTWKQADLILFAYTSTTTFGYALTTNRKIILLDTEKPFWNKKNFEYLKKRCTVIDVPFNNGFSFSKEKLRSELKTQSDNIDYSYVENYLI